jgi:hypothetical protein
MEYPFTEVAIIVVVPLRVRLLVQEPSRGSVGTGLDPS